MLEKWRGGDSQAAVRQTAAAAAAATVLKKKKKSIKSESPNLDCMSNTVGSRLIT